MADTPMFTSLLDTYAETNTVPTNWRNAQAELQKAPEYRKILEEFEPVISRLEASPDDDELIALCEKMSRGKPPN